MTNMTANINFDALAMFMLEDVDCNPEYEDDCFGIEFEGRRIYVERHPTYFMMELSRSEVFHLPRP